MCYPSPMTEDDSEQFLKTFFSDHHNHLIEEINFPHWVRLLDDYEKVFLGHLVLRTFTSLKKIPGGLIYPIGSLNMFAATSNSVLNCVKYVKTVKNSSSSVNLNHVIAPAASEFVEEIDLLELAVTGDGAELITVENIFQLEFDRKILASLDLRWLTPRVMQILLEKIPVWKLKIHGELDSHLIHEQRCQELCGFLNASQLFDIEDVAVEVVMHFPLHNNWWPMIRNYSTVITFTPGEITEFRCKDLPKLATIRIKKPTKRFNEIHYGQLVKALTDITMPKFCELELEDTDILQSLSGFLVGHGKNLSRLCVRTISLNTWVPAPFGETTKLKFAPELMLELTNVSDDLGREQLPGELQQLDLEILKTILEAPADHSFLNEQVEQPLTKYALAYLFPALRRYCPNLKTLEIEFDTPAALFCEFMLYILDSTSSPRDYLSYIPVCLVGDMPLLLMPIVLGLVRNWKRVSLRFRAPLENASTVVKLLSEMMSCEKQFHEQLQLIVLCDVNLVRAEACSDRVIIHVENSVPSNMLFAQVSLLDVPDYLAGTAYRYSVELNRAFAREILDIVVGPVSLNAISPAELSNLAYERTRCHLKVCLMRDLIEALAAKELYVSSGALVSISLHTGVDMLDCI
ncbi:hypothetical protein HDE_00860 [Halotydeus destructor]|nr:hypothetical protein HDE_00860 [Halotydeus destructor]